MFAIGGAEDGACSSCPHRIDRRIFTPEMGENALGGKVFRHGPRTFAIPAATASHTQEGGALEAVV